MEEMLEEVLNEPIVATCDETSENLLAGLERRISALETSLRGLSAIRAEGTSHGRKTSGYALAAKGITGNGNEVDGALESLSIEQRIAVKSGLIRAGLM